MGDILKTELEGTTQDTTKWNYRRNCPCCSFVPPSLLLNASDTPEWKAGKEGGEDLLSASEALEQLGLAEEKVKGLKIVDTHGHPHLQRDRFHEYLQTPSSTPHPPLFSLTCAVSESDWEQTLAYASTSDHILPALGIHPWYLSDLSPNWLTHLEELLQKHPSALVGEIGLCKAAKNLREHPQGKLAALERQRKVFEEQFRLACRMQRSVSIHCVRQQGVLLSVLREVHRECRFPPAIALHSFTGTAHHVKEILSFENLSRNSTFYFGFSHMVNVLMCSSEKSRRQGMEAVRAVPRDRILAESDVHAEDDVAVGTAGAIGYIAYALGEGVVDVARFTAENGVRFLESNLRG